MFAMRMRAVNARIILDARATGASLFRFKSALSRVILLHIASMDGECELQVLIKKLDATSVATRQHIQLLETEGLLRIGQHPSNRRCKVVALTEKAWALLQHYEERLGRAILRWQSDVVFKPLNPE